MIDADLLRQWIGREEVVTDVVTAALVNRFRATLGLVAEPSSIGEAAPRLIHFCLCQIAAPTDLLGEDGHPARGGFLPPVPLPRRMWAASDIRFVGDLQIGAEVRRRSHIVDVLVKSGRSGTLCFVTVDHLVESGDMARVHERQTIVYRAAEQAPTSPIAADVADAANAVTVVQPTSALLFRYSALTFNGHRIHYDRPYATGEEGYPGLVVHGPLQATLLFHLATQRSAGRQPDRFSFRGISPLFDAEPMQLHAAPAHHDTMSLWTSRPGGPAAMRAEAMWTVC